MKNTTTILDILREVSWRTDTGSPDFTNPHHIDLLQQVLEALGIPASEINQSIQNLRESNDDSKYVHLGRGVYVKQGQENNPDAVKFEKTADGKYTALASDEESEDITQYTADMLNTPEPGSENDNNKKVSDKKAAQGDSIDTSSKPTSQQLQSEADKKTFLKGMVDVLLKEDPTKSMGAGRFNMSRADLTIYKNYLNGDTPDIPSYNISDKDIDTVIRFVKAANPTYFKSFRERLRKKGDPPKELRTGEAGSQRIRAVLKHYLQTGGISAITGELVSFNESQLDHKVSLDNGGKDEPANWEFMESRFNQFKGALDNEQIMQNIQKKLAMTPDQERAKLLQIELKQFSKTALIDYWDKKFISSGDHGLTEASIDKMNKKQLDYLVKGWNKSHPSGTDFYIARYRESADRASGRAGGGRPISRGELVQVIRDKMTSAGLDIPALSETQTIDGAMEKILQQIATRKGQIQRLKAKK